MPVGTNVEGRLVRGNVKAGEIIRLPEGIYHVVSTYGESNAIMRADLKVETGRVTEAALNHRAATLTLKLVAAAGGESFAGTAFSVLTPGGDVIREVIGAFPSVTLAEGDYVVIARQGAQVYTREFHVDSGSTATSRFWRRKSSAKTCGRQWIATTRAVESAPDSQRRRTARRTGAPGWPGWCGPARARGPVGHPAHLLPPA